MLAEALTKVPLSLAFFEWINLCLSLPIPNELVREVEANLAFTKFASILVSAQLKYLEVMQLWSDCWVN